MQIPPSDYLRPGALDGTLGFSFPSVRWQLALSCSESEMNTGLMKCVHTVPCGVGSGSGSWLGMGQHPFRVRGSLQPSLF